MVLRSSCRIIGRCFFAVDGPPWIHGAPLIQLTRALTSLVQHAMTETKQIFGYAGCSVRQKRQHIDFTVPEVMALIGATCEPFRRHAGVFCASRCLQDMEQIESDGLLHSCC